MRAKNLLLRALTALVLVAQLLPAWCADTPPADEQPSRAEVQAMIESLEDPEARGKLIAQLRLLAEASGQQRVEHNAVVSATADLLGEVSTRVAEVGRSVARVGGIINELPAAARWVQRTIQDPPARERWARGLAQLAIVLAAAYFAYWLIGRLLRRGRRFPSESRPGTVLGRLGVLAAKLGLDLLPIVGFAAAGYLALTSLEPEAQIRIIPLAWINASIVAKTLMALGDAALAPGLPHLRVYGGSDETAEYLRIWLRRLSTTLVYGFMGLQAAALLGLKAGTYDVALSLLGLVALAMLLILVLQNRKPIAEFIQGDQSEQAPGHAGIRLLRRRAGQIWHLLASLYLVMLYGVWMLKVADGFVYIIKGTLLSFVVLAVSRTALQLIGTLFDRGLRVSKELRQRYPELEARANRYFPALNSVVNGLIYLVAALALLESWGFDAIGWALTGPGRVLGSTVARIGLIVLIALLVWEAASSMVERFLSEKDRHGRVQVVSARTKTLLTVGRNALLVMIGVVSTLMVLSELGVNIGPLLAGAGVLGLAIGFGSQRLVQDVITGVFILFQDLMVVGDVVKVGDKAGLVEALSIRSVRLRDLAGVVHTIPFSAIDSLSNLTKDFSCYVFEVGIAYRENVDEVMALLSKIGADLQADAELGALILEPIEVMGVDAFADSAVIIKGRLKTLPLKQWQVGRAFNRLVKLRFDAAGIEIPFPHRTVYFGVDKHGGAPAARLQMDRSGAMPASAPKTPSDEELAALAGVPTPDPETDG